MAATDMLELHAPGVGLSFRAKLLTEDNPDVVKLVLAQLPLQSVLGHVVISGEGIWMPTRIVHLGRNNMVERTPGAMYLYAPGQTIVMTYGKITESAKVNKFAQVLDEDMDTLRALGGIVWERTVALPRRSIVEINVRRVS